MLASASEVPAEPSAATNRPSEHRYRAASRFLPREPVAELCRSVSEGIATGITKPRLFADARGVWREDRPDHPFGILWEEIYRLHGHKIDGITETFTCVVLDFEYGEFVELYHDWPGFDQVVTAITERLVGIHLGWYQSVEQLGVADPPIEIWQREARDVGLPGR